MRFEQLGTTIPIYNKLLYNSRGQLAETREGLTPNDTSWQRGSIVNFYSTCWGMCWNRSTQTGDSMPNNNGNLKIQQVTIPRDDNAGYENRSDQFTQYFEYDSLNRLQFANEASWRQWYSYDRYGNRTINTDPNLTYGVNNLGFEAETSTNRLYAPGDLAQDNVSLRRMQYDDAGSLKKDTYTGAGDRTYDAENRMISALDNAGGTTHYYYDGDGHRVRRVITNQPEVWQVYGIGGELIAEYEAGADHSIPQKEYGYRNGQLLITTTGATAGWGAPPSFTPPTTLVSGLEIKLEHLTELRTAVNQLREHAGLSDFAFTVDPNPERYVTTVKADHILQLRQALEQARSHLGLSTTYEHPGVHATDTVYAIDFQELRNQILSAWNSGAGAADVRWLVSDQLGTPRMIFDQSGSLANVSRHDYLPFGEELGVNVGGRTPQQGYGAADGVRQHFTQKERDNETGLDYFKARYYSSAQGRFTSADAPFADQRQTDPSSWNSYAYVRNNPCNRTDPNGRCSPPPGLKPGQVGICIEAFIAGKTFKTFGAGNDRTFSGNDEKLTSKFRVDIIAERTPGNSKNLNVSQHTSAGVSYAVMPLVTLPTVSAPITPALQGTANSTLNSTQGSSNSASVSAGSSDGSTAITVPIEKNGNASFNVTTKAENAFADLVDFGSIRSSLNFTVNANNGKVGLDEGSKTGYPSFGIYSYVYDGKNIVTTTIREIPETKPEALKEPMRRIP